MMKTKMKTRLGAIRTSKTTAIRSAGLLVGVLFLSSSVPLALADTEENAPHCSNKTLKGSYGVIVSGTISNVGPILFVGRQTFDGQGGTTVTATLSRNGVIFPDLKLSGTYHVNPDCTGTMTVNGTENDLVIFSNGTEFRSIFKTSGDVVTVHGKRQFTYIE